MSNLSPTTPPALGFEDVTYRIKKRLILDHVSLTFARGDITGVLGPNGAGKTTLLDIISGLREPTEGRITVLDEQASGRSLAMRQKIGVVPQETALYDELKTIENLRFAASLYGVPHPERRIEEVLDLLDLSARAQDRVGHLSGGLRRRVTIARALLHSPDLLIIDEPTLGVDVEARHTIWSHLRLLRSSGTTIIVATNYLDEALALCDTVIVLRAGKVLTRDTPAALVARAGCCLEIDCSEAASKTIGHTLNGAEGVLRVTVTPTGSALFLSGSTVPEDIVRQVLQTAAISGYHVRAADLAEVFQALGDGTAEAA